MNMKWAAIFGLAATGLLAGPVGAATINDGLVPGVSNTIEDQDREAFFDVDNSGTISEGDVFAGFVRVDDFGPSGASANDQVYGVISTQINGIFNSDGVADTTGTIFEFGATTTAALSLPTLTGNANTAGGMFAVYDSAAPIGDLINNPALFGSDLNDLLNVITSNTLRLVGGIDNTTDFLTGVNDEDFAGGTATSALANAPDSLTFGSFTGGLSILFNNTNFEYDPSVLTNNPLTGNVLSQFGVGRGATAGAVNATGESIFTDGSAYNVSQCTDADGNNVACGVTTDADFFVEPRAVPAPGSLALIGLGLLGLTGARRWKHSV